MALVRRLLRRGAAELRDRVFPSGNLRVTTDIGVVPYFRRDLLGRRFWSASDFEGSEREVMRGLLKGATVFIDAGANLGIYSLLASKACGSGALVLAFEPSPIELRKLLVTIDWNDLRNVLVCPFALSDRTDTITFYESLEGHGALNRVDRPGDDRTLYRQTTVQAVTLDSYLAFIGVGRVDFIKIDVEGHELPLLRGARTTIERHRPSMMVEMEDKRSSATSTPLDIWNHLELLGYRWFQADASAGGLAPLEKPVHFKALNLFAVARERVAEVERQVSAAAQTARSA
jgi:FkbM family methyltransferase